MLHADSSRVSREAGGWPVSVYGTAAHWPAIARLMRHAETWLIAYHPGLAYWSAERVTGTAVRYVCACRLDELADKIESAP